MVTLQHGALAALLLATTHATGLQLPRFEARDPEASFAAMAEYLARDGGRWRASNPNHDPDRGTPPEFGLWFERHLDGRVLQLRIVVHYADRTVVSSHGQWSWHPGRGELHYLMTDRGGGVTEGVTTFPEPAMFRTEATRYGPDGLTAEHRDDNLLVSDSLHRNETFAVKDGFATSGGVYEWRRVTSKGDRGSVR